MRNAVIVGKHRIVEWNGVHFWNGTNWVNEYPDAKLYTIKEARKALKAASFFVDAKIVVGYSAGGDIPPKGAMWHQG